MPRLSPLSPIRIAAISISLLLHLAVLFVLTVPWPGRVERPNNAKPEEVWVVEIKPASRLAPPSPVEPAPQILAQTVPPESVPVEQEVPAPPQPPSMEGVDPTTLYDALGMDPPMESIRAGQDSQAWVIVQINVRGEPTEVTIESGAAPVDKQLEQAAREFILKSWRFEASAAPTVLRLPLVYF